MKTLKKICAFYLNSWWLPQVVVIIWTICGMFYASQQYGCKGMAYAILTLFGTAFLGLGWLASWIWLLCHKHWKRALLSFLFAVSPPLLFLFLAYLNTPP